MELSQSSIYRLILEYEKQSNIPWQFMAEKLTGTVWTTTQDTAVNKRVNY